MHPSTNGRNGNGTFTKGNAGGPGNPHGRRVAKLRALLVEGIADDDLKAVGAKLVELAKAGDLAAMKLLLSYTIGQPTPAPDPDKLEADEVRIEADKLQARETLSTSRQLAELAF